MLVWLMFMPPIDMFVSLRSRRPLIIVVLCLGIPAIVVLMVILKSPLIGFSSSGRLCPKEIAVIAEAAKMKAANRINLLFID